MTTLSAVPVLAIAAAACLVVAARARARTRTDAGPSANPAPGATSACLPALVALLARVPAPAMLVRAVRSPDPQSLLWGAGITGDDMAQRVRRARAAGIVVGVCAGAALAVVAVPLVVMLPVLAAAGRLAPDRVIASRAGRRRRQVVHDLPDLLDLMAICVQAGMALDPALRMTAHRLGGPLGDEVATMLSALDLGTPRRAAYRTMAERVGSDDLARLVASLLQADELGTPLASALAGQAEALRAVRRQAARDRAARAAPRIQLVVALVMVPGALLLVLGVMVVELAAQVAGVVA